MAGPCGASSEEMLGSYVTLEAQILLNSTVLVYIKAFAGGT